MVKVSTGEVAADNEGHQEEVWLHMQRRMGLEKRLSQKMMRRPDWEGRRGGVTGRNFELSAGGTVHPEGRPAPGLTHVHEHPDASDAEEDGEAIFGLHNYLADTHAPPFRGKTLIP